MATKTAEACRAARKVELARSFRAPASRGPTPDNFVRQRIDRKLQSVQEARGWFTTLCAAGVFDQAFMPGKRHCPSTHSLEHFVFHHTGGGPRAIQTARRYQPTRDRQHANPTATFRSL